MLAPVVHAAEWSVQTDYVIAFIIGIAFGAALEQGGFGNSRKLALNFYLRDMTVVKVMFTAVITAMSGIIILRHFGVLDIGEIWINPTYLWPGIIGGLIMGVGFVVGGYCPGTGLVGVSTLKTDAIVNIIGGLVGMFIAAEVIPSIYSWWVSSLLGERIRLPEALGISEGIIGLLIIVMALAMFAFSEFVERYFEKRDRS